MSDCSALVIIDDDDDDNGDDVEEDGDGSSCDDDAVNDETNGRFEFSIRADKVEEVNILKVKVQELYGVKIQKDIKAKEMGKNQNNERQWFSILGPLENCRQAKAFILAKCDPGEAAIFDFDPKLYNALSSELHKSRIEKESNTVLLFDHNTEGHVIIQGSDEMCVLVAMSLLEEIVYEASVNVAPYSDTKTDIAHSGQISGILSAQRERPHSYGSESQMELDIVDLVAEPSDVVNIMLSTDPEIQRLIKCGRDKNYTDDEIQEVLQKSSTNSKASEFIRALHTCRNMRTVSGTESSRALAENNGLNSPKTKTCDDVPRLESVIMQETENDVIVIPGFGDISVQKNCDKSGIKESNSSVSVDFKKHLTGSVCRDKETVTILSDSSPSGSSASDLIYISDVEERRQKAEASQERNRMLFLEQSPGVASFLKQSGASQVNRSDNASNPVEINDSGMDTAAELPSSKRRKKKKKKRSSNSIDHVKEENGCQNKYTVEHSGVSEKSLKGSSQPQYQFAAGKMNHMSPPRNFGLISQPPGRFPVPPVNQQWRAMSNPVVASAAVSGPAAFKSPRNPEQTGLRYIIIDGSNVAMSHGNGKIFSCRGIQIAVEHFRKRGHKEITVFVPQWRRQAPRYEDNPIKDQHILEDLKEDGIMNFTPSRRIPGKKNIVCYDDRFILRLAEDTNGTVVSNDNYRDLYLEKPEWSEIIENRVLSYTFVGDRFMLPDDPLGRDGPNLTEFLSFPGKDMIRPSASNARILPPDLHPGMHNLGPTAGYAPVVQRFPPPYHQPGPWGNRPAPYFPRYPFTSMPQPRGPIRAASPPRYIVDRATNIQRVPQPGSSNRASAPHSQTVAPSAQQHPMLARPRLAVETAKIRDVLKEIFPDEERLIDGLLSEYVTERNTAKLTNLVLSKLGEN